MLSKLLIYPSLGCIEAARQLLAVADIFGPFPKINSIIDFMSRFVDSDEIIRRPNVTGQSTVHITNRSYKMTFKDVKELYRHINYRIGGSCEIPHSAIPAICQKAGLDYQAEVAKVISRDLALGESALCEMVRNSIINDAKKLVEPIYKIDSVTIVHKLTSEEEAALIEIFPELDLRFKHELYHPHAYAAASRVIEEQINILNLGLERISTYEPPDGYDVVVKDSGGDVFKQIKRGRANFHSCSPILSIHDQQRHASRMASIATMTRLTSLQKKAMTKYNEDIRNDTYIFSCGNVSENCTIKAPFMLFLHSTYDRTATDIANAMTAADAKVAAGSFIFDPKMLIQESGEIKPLKAHYKIFEKNSVKYVNMSFVGDSSWTYTHRVDTYLTLMRNSVIRDSNGQCYFVNILSIGNSIVFFKLIRCTSKNVLPGVINHKIWFDNTDIVTVQTYDWEAEGYDSVKNHMRLVRFLAPKKLVDDAIAYAYGLDHNKFSVSNIYHALRSFSTRVVGTKAVCQAAYDMPPKRLFQLASAIFIKCFTDRFGITRATSEVTSEITRLREDKGISVLQMFKNLWDKFVTPTAPEPSKNDNIIYRESFENPGQVPLEGVGPLNRGNYWFERFLSFLIRWSAEPKHYSVHICDAVQFLDMETIIESDYSNLESRITNYLPCFEITDPANPFRPSVLSDEACDIVNASLISSECTLLGSNHCSVQVHVPAIETEPSAPREDVIPLDDLKIGSAIGDGNCLFDSLRQCLNVPISTSELKNQLLTSKEIADLPAYIIPDVIKVLASKNAWGGETEITLASMVFNVRIVLYSDELNFNARIYND